MTFPVERYLADEAATATLAADLAKIARRGDVLALRGGLGSGKTFFARAFIRALAGHAEDVPSPTFTLMQEYDLPGGMVYHFDLYRIDNGAEILELGMEDAFSGGITLIEWPERMGDYLPDERLDLELAPGDNDGARRITITPHGQWCRRLAALDEDTNNA